MAENYEFWLLAAPLLLGLGVISGLLAGLLGVGGGIILVPGLLALFHQFPMTHWPMHVAVATSLANIIFTGLSSAHSHFRRGNVDTTIVKILIPGVLLGTVLGVMIADSFNTQTLQFYFACVLFCISMILLVKPITLLNDLPSKPVTFPVSALFSAASSMIGIGGGSLFVPFLSMCSKPLIRAIGTAAVLGVAIALGGSITFAVTGFNLSGLPPYSLGYIWIPGVILTLITSVATAPIGSKWASRLPAMQLRRIFAVFLMIVCFKLAWEA